MTEPPQTLHHRQLGQDLRHPPRPGGGVGDPLGAPGEEGDLLQTVEQECHALISVAKPLMKTAFTYLIACA